MCASALVPPWTSADPSLSSSRMQAKSLREDVREREPALRAADAQQRGGGGDGIQVGRSDRHHHHRRRHLLLSRD